MLEALTKETSISVYWFGEQSEWQQEFVKYYNEVYNGKVEYVYRAWSLWHEHFITEYAAGTPVDLLYLYEMNFRLSLTAQWYIPIRNLPIWVL